SGGSEDEAFGASDSEDETSNKSKNKKPSAAAAAGKATNPPISDPAPTSKPSKAAPAPEKPPTKPTPAASSQFLPSLMAGYISGSSSDSDSNHPRSKKPRGPPEKKV